MSTCVLDMNHFSGFLLLLTFFHGVFLLKGLMLCLGEGIYKMNSEHLIVAEKGIIKTSWGRGVAEVTSCLQRTQRSAEMASSFLSTSSEEKNTFSALVLFVPLDSQYNTSLFLYACKGRGL